MGRGFAVCILFAMASASAAAAQVEIPSGELCFKIKAENEKSACDAAIAAESNAARRAGLLYARAWGKIELEQTEAAVTDLNEVIYFDPRFARALHERAYALAELGEYAAAEKDLTAQEQLEPNDPGVYQERAFVRFPLGNPEGAYADRARVVELMPGDAQAMWDRGKAVSWLGRLDDAASDYASARVLAEKAGNQELSNNIRESEAYLVIWRTTTPGVAPVDSCLNGRTNEAYARKTMVGDCTAAFLAAKGAQGKADALTQRSSAWLIGHQDREAAAADLQLAAGLTPGSAGAHSNLGYAYLQVRHSWAAAKEFEKSLAIEKTWVALAGLGAAKYNRGDKKAAFEASKASFEMRPNEAALYTLGDLAHDDNDVASAKLYWMGAYHLGSRDDSLIARLKSIGVSDPEKEPKG